MQKMLHVSINDEYVYLVLASSRWCKRENKASENSLWNHFKRIARIILHKARSRALLNSILSDLCLSSPDAVWT